MLYYAIAMQRLFYLLVSALLSTTGFFSAPQQAPLPTVSISTPVEGQVLQGVVAVTGSIPAEGFLSAELSFAYAKESLSEGSTAVTWFLIQQIDQPVLDGILTEWDTTAITDGDYHLQLTVTLLDGQKITARVNGLRVRNYTPIETKTPTIVPPTHTPLPSGTPTPTFTPSPSATPKPTDTALMPTVTALPTNSARLSHQAVAGSLGRGALVGIGAIALLGIYALARTISKPQ